MNIQFDVIIATYNRPAIVEKFVKELLNCTLLPEKIIIVDSSDAENESIQKLPKVVYCRSSHKNQPYQRYVGYLKSTSDIIIYFDDDLEIINNTLFNELINLLTPDNIVGATVGVDYHNSISNNLNSSILYNKLPHFKNLLWYLTGVPKLKEGKIGYVGVVGPFPSKISNIEYFRGPCMAFKRKILSELFTYELFALFERKLAMGEDKVISIRANKFGKLIINPVNYLYHPAVESNYFSNIESFTQKNIYSRLYLSKIFCETFNKTYLFTYLHYYWFIFWRLIIALLNFSIKPDTNSKSILKGVWKGMVLTFTLPFNAKLISPGINWENDARIDAGK
jgi:glycosyltransferase involved in cell wall biosynthesis